MLTENMDKFELGIAVQKVYDFIWDEFCDWYVETAKYRIYHKEEEKAAADCVLWVLKTVLKQAVEITSSVYAVYHRGDLQRTGTGRRIADDVRVATVSCGVGFPGRRKCDGTCKRDHTWYPQYARRDEMFRTTARQKYMSCVRILKSVTESAHWRTPSSR